MQHEVVVVLEVVKDNYVIIRFNCINEKNSSFRTVLVVVRVT